MVTKWAPLSLLQRFMLEELGQLNCGLPPSPVLPLVAVSPPMEWRQDEKGEGGGRHLSLEPWSEFHREEGWQHSSEPEEEA